MRRTRRLRWENSTAGLADILHLCHTYMRLQDLQAHSEPYVTVAELADYWLVSRKQIYKQIDAGILPAIRLGPRLLRIRTADALKFERNANMHPPRQVEPTAVARPPLRRAR